MARNYEQHKSEEISSDCESGARMYHCLPHTAPTINISLTVVVILVHFGFGYTAQDIPRATEITFASLQVFFSFGDFTLAFIQN